MLFNIIYTRNTVELLWPFTRSVLDNSNSRFRLVSNNCTNDEIQFLQDRVSLDSRLLFHNMNNDEVLQHHVVLNRLFEMDHELDYFCFMDSDILATGLFLDEFRSALELNVGVFSCRPILESPDAPEEDFNLLQGRHFYCRQGQLIGGSYFAMYQRNALEVVMDKYQIDFSRASWNHISDEIKDKLIDAEMDYEYYDTGKLLNALLLLNGFSFKYLEHENLHHVGGLSWNRSILKENDLEFEEKIKSLNDPTLTSILRRRKGMAQYFASLINALVTDGDMPELPTFTSPLEFRRYNKVRYALVEIYRKGLKGTSGQA